MLSNAKMRADLAAIEGRCGRWGRGGAVHCAVGAGLRKPAQKHTSLPQHRHHHRCGGAATADAPPPVPPHLLSNKTRHHPHHSTLPPRILELLSAASGNILDDEELINTLAQAKVRGRTWGTRLPHATRRRWQRRDAVTH